MAKKNQSNRLTKQHKKPKGVVGIFGDGAKSFDYHKHCHFYSLMAML